MINSNQWLLLYNSYVKSKSFFKHFNFFILDEFLLLSAFIFSCLIRNIFDDFYFDQLYINVAVVIFFTQFFISLFTEEYRNIMHRGYYVEFIETIKNSLIVSSFVILYMFLTQSSTLFSRATLILFFMASIVFVYIGRVLLKTKINSNKKSNKKSLVLVGKKEEIKKAIENFSQGEYEIKGVFLTDSKVLNKPMKNIQIIEDFKNFSRLNAVEDVLFFDEDNDIYEHCMDMGITVHEVVLSSKLSPSVVYVDEFAGYGVITRRLYDDTSNNMIAKRIIDIVVSLFGMLVVAILTILVGPFIYFSDPGPIFFVQNRVGKNGKRFRLYKFRSMYKNADDLKKELMSKNEMDGLMFKIENDPRIISGIGTFIRKTSIDEFPQFFNVLKGDMSVVGTRPPTEDEYEKYDFHHMRRLSIKPGITGLWQISGRNEIKSFEEVVKLDNKYIDEWSLGLDFKIMLKTIYVLFTGKGAR